MKCEKPCKLFLTKALIPFLYLPHSFKLLYLPCCAQSSFLSFLKGFLRGFLFSKTLMCLTGSWEDTANNFSSWLYETLQKHSWTSHGVSSQVHSAELDEWIQEMGTNTSSSLFDWWQRPASKLGYGSFSCVFLCKCSLWSSCPFPLLPGGGCYFNLYWFKTYNAAYLEYNQLRVHVFVAQIVLHHFMFIISFSKIYSLLLWRQDTAFMRLKTGKLEQCCFALNLTELQ